MIKKGIAFVCEGETEEIFYRAFIDYYCGNFANIDSYCIKYNDIGEEYVCITTQKQEVIVKFNCVSTISQMTNAQHWVKNECINETPDISWSIYLCYDTDSYNNDITQFYEGEWAKLRESIQEFSEKITIVDLAAQAEIEDIMLIDTASIANYLGVDSISVPTSSKGKGKMKEIFRENGKIYHEGYRANKLINSLNFDYICNNSPIDLNRVRDEIFV